MRRGILGWWLLSGEVVLTACGGSYPAVEADQDREERHEAAIFPCDNPLPVSNDPPVLEGSRIAVAWGTAELQVVLIDRLREHVAPERVIVKVDGMTVLQAPAAGTAGVYELMRGTVEPGRHDIRVTVKAKGKGDWHWQSYTVSAGRKVEVTEAHPRVEVVAWEALERSGNSRYIPAVCFVHDDVGAAEQ